MIIAIPECLHMPKKRDIGSKQKTLIFYLFIFKTKKTFILILHLPMAKLGEKKESIVLLFCEKKKNKTDQ